MIYTIQIQKYNFYLSYNLFIQSKRPYIFDLTSYSDSKYKILMISGPVMITHHASSSKCMWLLII